MTFQFTNNAATTTATDTAVSADSIALKVGTGVLFPQPSDTPPGYVWRATLSPGNGARAPVEIVEVIERVGDTLGVVRGVEGTLALEWPKGSRIELLATAGVMGDFTQRSQLPYINILQEGGKANDESFDNALIINDAVARCAPAGGGTIVVPGGPGGGMYQTLTEPVINVPNIKLVIEQGAVWKQMTYGFAGVQVRADHVTVTGGGTILQPYPKTKIEGAYEGRPARGRCSGVLGMGASYCLVTDLTMENFVGSAHLRQTEALSLVQRIFNNRIDRINSNHHDFGIVTTCQQNTIITNVFGYDTVRSQGEGDEDDSPGDGPAPHLLYITGAPTVTLSSQSVIVANCVDFLNIHSSSYKARFIRGLTMNGLQSQLTMRALDLDAHEFEVVSMMHRDGLGQAVLNASATSTNGQIVNPLVYINRNVQADYPDLVGDLTIDFDKIRAIVLDASTSNITVRGGKFSTEHLLDDAPAFCAIDGTNNRMIDVEIEERGANAWPVVFPSTAVNCKLIRPAVSQANGKRVVDINAGALNTVVEIDPSVLNFTYDNTSDSDDGTNSVFNIMTYQTKGVWTPVVTFTVPGDFATLNADMKGWWIKEGRKVTVGFSAFFDVNNYTTTIGDPNLVAGDLLVNGLPFPAESPTAGGYTYSVGMGLWNNLFQTINGLSILLPSGTSTFKFHRSVAGSNGNNLNPLNLPPGTLAVRIGGQMVYWTT